VYRSARLSGLRKIYVPFQTYYEAAQCSESEP